ncbi:hypothetical protein BLS_008656 [Venturia inaequalis]|uniref:Uncharacterized protein n=1 Tax=Venturia inaequalis TaxID=5025 RepID=A0A8H3U558_VENIN|nr:hypothetical protein BLS_008656 [Venturia inaequalis]KAE9983722.1 hypothetical protein EG327_005399 [Venturia inaequalis]RDI79411.1 hypothetical protein Vi05172_g10562 [Venturia inaequalis]
MDHQEVLDRYVDPAALKSTLINGFGIGNYETQYKDGKWIINTKGRKLTDLEIEAIYGMAPAPNPQE